MDLKRKQKTIAGLRDPPIAGRSACGTHRVRSSGRPNDTQEKQYISQ